MLEKAINGTRNS